MAALVAIAVAVAVAVVRHIGLASSWHNQNERYNRHA